VAYVDTLNYLDSYLKIMHLHGFANLITLTFLFILTAIIVPMILQTDQKMLGQLAALKGAEKVVIINFDDNRKSQFTQAKNILDKYGFKATFYAVCNYLDNKEGYMNWTQLEKLYNDGHDIGSHSMNHENLSDSSINNLQYQIADSKACLMKHGINATSFAYPFNDGWHNKTVVKIVSENYDLARTGSSILTFLHCDGWKKWNQTDCSTYTKDGKLNYANRYSIRGWNHELSTKQNPKGDSKLFERFINSVNSQLDHNKDGTITAIPIIIYHGIGNDEKDSVIHTQLFQKEMKYLHDNHFRVLSMKDLSYDNKNNYFFLK
jgi:hypothetical protein